MCGLKRYKSDEKKSATDCKCRIFPRGLLFLLANACLMTENCKSRLTGDSAGQKSTDERKRDAAFIGAGIAVFIIVLAGAAILLLVRRRRNIKQRQRSVAESKT